jgi:hypothetical protein
MTKFETTIEGPAISQLHHRMTAAPKELFAPNDYQHLPALVHDLLYRHQTQFSAEVLAPFRDNPVKCPWYATCYLLLYLYSDNSFTSFKLAPEKLLKALQEKANELYSSGKNAIYVEDVDRREEFIRVALAAVNLRPQGETQIQAEDRLMTVSSFERKRVMEAAKIAEERAAQIREALAKQAALEAANKMSRE